MRNRGEVRPGETWLKCVCALGLVFILIFTSLARADLGPENILILVNADSPTSRCVANLYREYYPEIQESQVLVLNGLADCSGPSSTPADEIITRQTYHDCIAEPVRQYLSAYDLLDSVKVIVTTAGIPYRIEDSDAAYAGVVMPAASNPLIIKDCEALVDAASVESELACLWYAGYGPNSFGLQNRIVNPYHGCRSSFDLFERQAPVQSGLVWSHAWSKSSGVADPLMEGQPHGYGTKDRGWGPEHLYLVCRLDGPKKQGESAIFAVRQMLERSKRASNPAYGVNPSRAFIVLDDAPNAAAGNIDFNRVFNLHDSAVNFWEYFDGQSGAPDAYGLRNSDDYVEAFFNLLEDGPMQNIGDLYFGTSDLIHGIAVFEDYRPHQCAAASVRDVLGTHFSMPGEMQGLVAYSCFGRNGDEGRSKDYLLCGGDDDEPLYSLCNGAVFTSLESFNAVTMFSDASTSQAKIVDFITIGGSGAIGHVFEPQSDAVIDNEFFLYNLFADNDGDSRADLTFAEAAFTGIPYLSWAEVVIGDPLMRISYGNDHAGAWKHRRGDADGDGRVNYRDLMLIRQRFGGSILPGADLDSIEKYDDQCDLDRDGRINYRDMILTKQQF